MTKGQRDIFGLVSKHVLLLVGFCLCAEFYVSASEVAVDKARLSVFGKLKTKPTADVQAMSSCRQILLSCSDGGARFGQGFSETIVRNVREDVMSRSRSAIDSDVYSELLWALQSKPYSRGTYKTLNWYHTQSHWRKAGFWEGLHDWAEKTGQKEVASTLSYYGVVDGLMKGNHSQAVDDAQRSFQQGYSQADRVETVRALNLVKQGNYAEAMKLLEEMPAKWPESSMIPDAKLLVAWINWRTGDEEQAIVTAREIAERYPETWQGHNRARQFLKKYDPSLRPVAQEVAESKLVTYSVLKKDEESGMYLWQVFVDNKDDQPVEFLFAESEMDGKRLRLENNHLEMWYWGLRESRGRTCEMWHQFYPSSTVEPGQSIVYQMCLDEVPADSHLKLKMVDSLGMEHKYEAKVERPAPKRSTVQMIGRRVSPGAAKQPAKTGPPEILRVTYASDYSRMFVQYRANGRKLNRTLINGSAIEGYAKLECADADIPQLLSIDPPMDVSTGLPLHITLEFEGDLRCDSLTRAVAGPALVAWRDSRIEDNTPLGVDEQPVIQLTRPLDPTSDDRVHGELGSRAPKFIGEQKGAYLRNPGVLFAQRLTPSATASTRHIYEPIYDALNIDSCSVKTPVKNWSLAREDAALESERNNGCDKPWVWSCDPHKVLQADVPARTLDMLAWMSIMSGSKGINYVNPGGYDAHAMNSTGMDMRGKPENFADYPEVVAAVNRINKDVKSSADMIAPLVPVQASNVSPDSSLKQYTAWSGDKGIMVLVRGDQGISKTGAVELSIPKPLGKRAKNAKDLFSAESFKTNDMDEQITIELPDVDLFRVIWIDLG
ncbi:hypothetical protein BVX97_03870 [bacterium E08(2017)]|nr:hypothetical protein BVX97_03870 [bacterium E08(2017)]